MLERYSDLLSERGFDWGEDFDASRRILVEHLARFAPERALSATQATTPDEDPLALLRPYLDGELPAGVAVVFPDRLRLPAPLPFVLPGRSVTYHLFHIGADGNLKRVSEVDVSAEHPFLDGPSGRARAVDEAAPAALHLRSDDVTRWSVRDGRGGAVFPEGTLQKFGWRGQPYFYGKELILEVPAGALSVVASRGTEFRCRERNLHVAAGDTATVDVTLDRIYDAAARGWYGGDLHVHMNYFGDDVATPQDAATMQRGEGLHLMNLAAANAVTSLVYDQEAFEHYLGQDLPWSHSHSIARWGIEFRNDLFGHFHALNPATPPTRYYTGHERSDHWHDWPPNAVAAEEMRNAGATIGYAHPVSQPMGDGGSPAPVFTEDKSVRSCEARELVADAALGLVDSMDIGGVGSLAGTEYLYHRLLGTGLRLAATAGTDTMLQNARIWPVSNPPGWFRAYADLQGEALTVEAWQAALRAGRTFVTNGPWLELSVSGAGIGDTVALPARGAVRVTAAAVGLGISSLDIVGPDGLLARTTNDQGRERVDVDVAVPIEASSWIAAICRGPEHHSVMGPDVYAHTSPVWVEIDGKPVGRADDAAWCLDWLDRFEHLASSHGHIDTPEQFGDLVQILDQARAYYRRVIDAAH